LFKKEVVGLGPAIYRFDRGQSLLACSVSEPNEKKAIRRSLVQG
jgi:hypothetical protein